MQRCLSLCKCASRAFHCGIWYSRHALERNPYARNNFARSRQELWAERRRRDTKFFCSIPAQTISSQAVLDEVRAKLGDLSTTQMIPSAPPVVLVISGPSGVGKDAVIKALQASRPDLHFVVTATSRQKRPGEVNGVDYWFVSKAEFETWIQDGRLLEHAVVYGEYKGIPLDQVQEALDKGTDVVLRLDIQGAATVRQKLPSVVSIFLVARSEEELVRRLIDRKTEPLDKMLIRVRTAREETLHINEFDYVVVNKDQGLADAVREIETIIAAEKMRVSRLLAQRSAPQEGSQLNV